MGQIEDKEGTFPEGYEHVEERLNDATGRVQQIDEQIKNIPKEQGPTLRYDPPYGVGRVVPGTRDKTRTALKDMQHEIKMDTLSRTEADTRTDNKTGRVVRDTVREKLFPNPYRQISKEDRLDDRGTPKDIERSQDFMDAELVARAAERKAAVQPQKETPEKQEKTDLSMSARFSMSLSYTKATEKSDRAPAPSCDRQQDRDRD